MAVLVPDGRLDCFILGPNELAFHLQIMMPPKSNSTIEPLWLKNVMEEAGHLWFPIWPEQQQI